MGVFASGLSQLEKDRFELSARALGTLRRPFWRASSNVEIWTYCQRRLRRRPKGARAIAATLAARRLPSAMPRLSTAAV